MFMKHKLYFLIISGFLFIISSCSDNAMETLQFQSTSDLSIGNWIGIVKGTKDVDTNLEISLDFTETTITVSLSEFEYGMSDTEIEDNKRIYNLGKIYWNDIYKIVSDNEIEISLPTNLTVEYPKLHKCQFSFNSNKDTLLLKNLFWKIPVLTVFGSNTAIPLTNLFPNINDLELIRR